MIKIGNLNIENNVFLAPMAGTTDKVFRTICRSFGCGLVYSEMVSAKGLTYNSKNTARLLETDPAERPSAIQIFGSDPAVMAEAAKEIAALPIDIIDINMGCPVPKIVKNGEGAALMLKPDLVGKIVYAVSSAVNIPVTVKIRKGFNNANINAPLIAKVAEDNGAAAVAVHGRTREQYYAGLSDRKIIAEVKKSVNIPVIGNGDITDPESAKAMFEETGCDAIMIGRACEGDPWIFGRVNEYLKTGILPSLPSKEEIFDLIFMHLDLLCEYKGEHIAIMEMRRHIGKYIKGFPNCAILRTEINKTSSKDEMKQLLARYRSELDNH